MTVAALQRHDLKHGTATHIDRIARLPPAVPPSDRQHHPHFTNASASATSIPVSGASSPKPPSPPLASPAADSDSADVRPHHSPSDASRHVSSPSLSSLSTSSSSTSSSSSSPRLDSGSKLDKRSIQALRQTLVMLGMIVRFVSPLEMDGIVTRERQQQQHQQQQ